MSSSPTLAREIQPSEIVARRRYAFLARLISLGCVLSSPVWLWALLFSVNQDAQAPSLIFVPLIIVVCVVMFIPLWSGDPYLKQLLSAGILARFAAASLRSEE